MYNDTIKPGQLSLFNGLFPLKYRKNKKPLSKWQQYMDNLAAGVYPEDINADIAKAAFESFSGDYFDASSMYSTYAAVFKKPPVQRMLTLSEEYMTRYITVGTDKIILGEAIDIVGTYNALLEEFGGDIWLNLWSTIDDATPSSIGSQEEDSETDPEKDYAGREKEAGTHILSDRNYTQRYRLIAAHKDGVLAKLTFRYALLDLQIDSAVVGSILKSIKFCKRNKPKSMEYLVYSREGFNSVDLPVREQNIDIAKQYNDDLPDAAIRSHLQEQASGIVLLHGAPGTGKTSYIRHLALTVPRRFVFLDKSMFKAMTDASFIDMLDKKKNSVFVLEDCEDVLRDRSDYNEAMSTILNLSDGILGDGFNIKFLCTFNCPLDKIDTALTRKGRLKLKYEFKPLVQEKAGKLLKEMGSTKEAVGDMTLADIYGADKDNGFKKPIEKPGIGF